MGGPQVPPEVADIVCKVVPFVKGQSGDIQDGVLVGVCDLIGFKFPHVRLEPDCPTSLAGTWDAAVAECPEYSLDSPTTEFSNTSSADMGTQPPTRTFATPARPSWVFSVVVGHSH